MAPRRPDDVDPHLIRSLRMLGDRYGPLGVALAAAGLADPAVLVRQLTATDAERASRVRETGCGVCEPGTYQPHCPAHRAHFEELQRQRRDAPPLDAVTPAPLAAALYDALRQRPQGPG